MEGPWENLEGRAEAGWLAEEGSQSQLSLKKPHHICVWRGLLKTHFTSKWEELGMETRGDGDLPALCVSQQKTTK